MENTCVISTHKHGARLFTVVVWTCICSFITGLAIYGTIVKFQWTYLLIILVAALATAYFGSSLRAFIKGGKLFVHIRAEKDGLVISNKNAQGEDLQPEIPISLQNIRRAYLKEYRRKIRKDKWLALENEQGKVVEEVDLFPEEYDCSSNDFETVLQFIHQQYPHIELGFRG